MQDIAKDAAKGGKAVIRFRGQILFHTGQVASDGFFPLLHLNPSFNSEKIQ